MPRRLRKSPAGVVFHPLNRGVGRRWIFEKEDDYAAFERVMAHALEAVPVRLLSYCLMPNHWYLLLCPREDGQLARFMQRLTMTHTRRWQEHYHQVGHLGERAPDPDGTGSDPPGGFQGQAVRGGPVATGHDTDAGPAIELPDRGTSKAPVGIITLDPFSCSPFSCSTFSALVCRPSIGAPEDRHIPHDQDWCRSKDRAMRRPSIPSLIAALLAASLLFTWMIGGLKRDNFQVWWRRSGLLVINDKGGVLIELRIMRRFSRSFHLRHDRSPPYGWEGFSRRVSNSRDYGVIKYYHGQMGGIFLYDYAGVFIPLWLPLVILISLAIPPRLRRWRADRRAGFDVTINKQKDEAAN